MSIDLDRIKTRGNLQVDENRLPYKATTEEVEDYLTGMFRNITDGLRARGVKNVKPITVDLSVVSLGKSFYPFMIMLPEEVLNKKAYNPDMPSVFETDDEGGALLKEWYYKLLLNYMYDKWQINDLYSPERKRALGMSAKDLQDIRKYSKPFTVNTENEYNQQGKTVMVLLDPIKVFHDMATFVNNPKQRFDVFIDKAIKLEGSQYIFKMTREVSTRSKKSHQKSLEDKLKEILNDRQRKN